jgi:hypothetical protein
MLKWVFCKGCAWGVREVVDLLPWLISGEFGGRFGGRRLHRRGSRHDEVLAAFAAAHFLSSNVIGDLQHASAAQIRAYYSDSHHQSPWGCLNFDVC